MKWERLNSVQFSGRCMECKKWIKRGEQVLWARNVGVKHIECAEGAGQAKAAQTVQTGLSTVQTGLSTVQTGLSTVQGPSITCAVCGRPAGCGTCELADSCDTKKVSQLCICRQCNTGDAMAAYTAAVARKFPALSGR